MGAGPKASKAPTRAKASAGKDRARAPAKERAQRAKDAKHEAQAPNPPSTRARAVSFANPPPPDATPDAPTDDQHRRSRAPAARPPPPFVAPYPPSSTRQMRSSSGPGPGPGPPGPAIATHPGRTAPGGPPAAAKAAAPRGGAARAGGISPQQVGAAAATRAIEHLAGARGSLSSSLSELTDHHHHHAAGVAAPPVLFSGPGGGPGMSAGPPGSHAHVQMSPGGGYVLGPGARWNFAHAGFLVDVEERVGSKDSPNAGESADGPPARANEATKAAETETPSPPEDGRRFDDATLGSGDGSDKGSADPSGSDKGSADPTGSDKGSDPSGSGPHGVGGGPAPSPARPRSGARGVGYLVHTMSSAAPARRPSRRCGETRAVFGEHAHRLVREMMLRQQNEFELQLMELHRVLETQRQLTKEPSPPKSGSVGGGKEGPHGTTGTGTSGGGKGPGTAECLPGSRASPESEETRPRESGEDDASRDPVGAASALKSKSPPSSAEGETATNRERSGEGSGGGGSGGGSGGEGLGSGGGSGGSHGGSGDVSDGAGSGRGRGDDANNAGSDDNKDPGDDDGSGNERQGGGGASGSGSDVSAGEPRPGEGPKEGPESKSRTNQGGDQGQGSQGQGQGSQGQGQGRGQVGSASVPPSSSAMPPPSFAPSSALGALGASSPTSAGPGSGAQKHPWGGPSQSHHLAGYLGAHHHHPGTGMIPGFPGMSPGMSPGMAPSSAAANPYANAYGTRAAPYPPAQAQAAATTFAGMMMPPGGMPMPLHAYYQSQGGGYYGAPPPGAGGFGAPAGPGAPLSWDAAVKLAARKAFDEQQHRQRDAYNLATRPWREEGGGDHRPGDPTAGADAAHPTTTTLTGPGGAEAAAARRAHQRDAADAADAAHPAAAARAAANPTLNPGAGAASTERRPNFDRRGGATDAAVPRGEPPPPRTAATTHLGAGGTAGAGGAPPTRMAPTQAHLRVAAQQEQWMAAWYQQHLAYHQSLGASQGVPGSFPNRVGSAPEMRGGAGPGPGPGPGPAARGGGPSRVASAPEPTSKTGSVPGAAPGVGGVGSPSSMLAAWAAMMPPPPRTDEVTQMVRGGGGGAGGFSGGGGARGGVQNHPGRGAESLGDASTARRFHLPVPQPPGPAFPFPAYPGSASGGPPPNGQVSAVVQDGTGGVSGGGGAHPGHGHRRPATMGMGLPDNTAAAAEMMRAAEMMAAAAAMGAAAHPTLHAGPGVLPPGSAYHGVVPPWGHHLSLRGGVGGVSPMAGPGSSSPGPVGVSGAGGLTTLGSKPKAGLASGLASDRSGGRVVGMGAKKGKGPKGSSVGAERKGDEGVGGGAGPRLGDGAGPVGDGKKRKKGRALAEEEHEADDAGSDSMMTGQPGHSEGAPEVTRKEEKGNANAPVKKPRSERPGKKDGPKDQSAADILMSIMKA